MTELSRDGKHAISFTLNGEPVSGHAEPRLLLTDFLNYELGLTGNHVGCEHGVCGACTILVDGVPGRACLTFAVQADGRDVMTVEGIAGRDGDLNDLQLAFRKHHALQCGYCTPGILMSLTAYLEHTPEPTEEELRDMLSGHICRCTGYVGMVRAVMDVVEQRKSAAG